MALTASPAGRDDAGMLTPDVWNGPISEGGGRPDPFRSTEIEATLALISELADRIDRLRADAGSIDGQVDVYLDQASQALYLAVFEIRNAQVV